MTPVVLQEQEEPWDNVGMTTVNWARESGDRIEEFVASLIAARRERTVRIRPSQGDGGVDVRVQTPDGFEIYQVKRYSTNLTSTEKRSIERSWHTFMTETAGGLSIASWNLVLPLDPTPENDAWLSELTAGVDFDINWVGLPTLDGWAADNRRLTDYFFGDGAERLHQLMTLAFAGGSAIPGTQPADDLLGAITDRAAQLADALEEVDPYYRYQIELRTGSMPDLSESIEDPAIEGLMMTRFEGTGPNQYLALHIIERFPGAALFKPIQQSVELRAEPGTADHDAIERFMYYGAPFSELSAHVTKTTGPPGTAIDGATLLSSLAPSASGLFPACEIRLISPEGSVLASAPVSDLVINNAPRGAGQFVGATMGRTTRVEFYIGAKGRDDEMIFRTYELGGHLPHEIKPEVYLLSQMTAGTCVYLCVASGKPLLGPWPMTGENEIQMAAVELLGFIDALTAIQTHTYSRVTVPSTSLISREDVLNARHAALLLAGKELRGRWTEWPVPDLANLPPASGRGEAFRYTSVTSLTVEIGGQMIVTDMDEETVFESARQATREVDQDGSEVYLIPGENDIVRGRAIARQS